MGHSFMFWTGTLPCIGLVLRATLSFIIFSVLDWCLVKLALSHVLDRYSAVYLDWH